MDVMQLRRNLLINLYPHGNEGWHKTTYIATEDTTRGDTTIGAIESALPNNYRYAIALKHNPTNAENNSFLACVFLPTRSEVHGMRVKNGQYQNNANYRSGTYDFILRNEEKVDVLWRTEPLLSDVPNLTPGWSYRTIQPGTITRANALETAFANISEWNILVSVADIDFNTIPTINRTYCESIVINRSSFTGNGTYLRTNGEAYQAQTNWGSSYDCQVGESTLIANFYF